MLRLNKNYIFIRCKISVNNCRKKYFIRLARNLRNNRCIVRDNFHTLLLHDKWHKILRT